MNKILLAGIILVTMLGSASYAVVSGLGVPGNLTVTGNFTMEGAGTFNTGTGAVTINGNTTISGANTFSTGTGAVTLNGNTSLVTGRTLQIADNGALTKSGTHTYCLNNGTTQAMVQGGSVALTGGAGTITFPTAFKAATTPAVIVDPGAASGNANPYVSSVTNTGASVNGNTLTGTCYWYAIGDAP